MTDILPTPGLDAPPVDDSYEAQQANLQRARREIAGPIPIIDDAPVVTATLPRGLFYNGSWQRVVEVRELTGADEEALSKLRDPTEMYDAVVGRGTVRVGDQDLTSMSPIERQVLLRQLLIGERDMVFHAVVRAAYGEERRLPMTCQFCQAEQEMVLKLSEDFVPKVVPNVDQTSFSLTTSKGLVVQYRPATGADQKEILDRKGLTVAEQNTILLQQCITSVNGDVVVDPHAFALDLSVGDRREILKAMLDRQPSIDLTVKLPCLTCGEVNTFALTWADLFRA
jgi:hypothetical protein